MNPQCWQTIITAGIVVPSLLLRSAVAWTSMRENSLTIHLLSLQRGQLPAPLSLSAAKMRCLSSVEIPL